MRTCLGVAGGSAVIRLAGLVAIFLMLRGVSLAQSQPPGGRRHLMQTANPPRFGELTYSSVRDNRYWDTSVMDIVSGTVRRISRQSFTVIAYDWTHDGSRLVFVTNRDGNFEIYTMDANGGDWRRITSTPGADYGPEWSPDGRHIAYSEDVGGGTQQVFVVDPDGANRVQLTFGAAGGLSTVWSPDGKRIAYVSGQTIRVMNSDGSSPVSLVSSSSEKYPCDWSPRGTHLLYMSRQGGIFKLFTYRLADAVIEAVPTGDYDAWAARWSPDGTLMSFYSYGIGSVGFPGMFAVFLMNPDGSNLRQVTTLTSDDRSWHPIWRP